MTRSRYQFIWLITMLFVLVLGLSIRLLLIEEHLESDDLSYMDIAEKISQKSFISGERQLTYRIGIIIPLALLIKLFGFSLISYYTFSIGYLMLLLTALLLFTREAFGLKVAYLAGILYIPSFILFNQSTNVLPDIPAFTWILFSLFFFLRSITGRGQRIFLFLAAFFGFLAYLCKEPVLVFFITIPLLEMIKKRTIKRSFCYAMIVGLFIVLECTIYFFVTGDFFIRYKHFQEGVNSWIINQPSFSFWEFLLNPPLQMVKYYSGIILLIGGLSGLLFAIIRKNSTILVLLAGSFVLYVFYSYSFVSINPWIPALPPNSRYVTGIYTIFAICLAWSIVLIYKRMAKFRIKQLRNPLLGIIMLCIFLFLFSESLKNANSIIFRNDKFFIADRLLKEHFKSPLKDSVFAIPSGSFRLYPNFQGFSFKKKLSSTEYPFYLLYSTDYITRKMKYAEIAGDKKKIQFFNRVLALSDQRKVIEYKGIVLAYLENCSNVYDTLFDISKTGSPWKLWNLSENAAFSVSDEGYMDIALLNSTGNPFDLYTPKGKFHKPPVCDSMIMPDLRPFQTYRISLLLTIEKPIAGLTIFLSEYDTIQRIRNIPVIKRTVPGGELLKTHDFVASPGAKKLRLFFTIRNTEKQNRIKVNNIVICRKTDCK